MSRLQTPFRYDFVGSFLRPGEAEGGKEAVCRRKDQMQQELDRMTEDADPRT